jgi:hypothetical protein
LHTDVGKFCHVHIPTKSLNINSPILSSIQAVILSKKHHMKPFSTPSLFAIAYLAIWPFIAAARLLNSLSELDVNSQYDFIIVGGTVSNCLFWEFIPDSSIQAARQEVFWPID